MKRSKTEHWKVPHRPWHVLVVADDPEGAEIMVRLLARAGHEVSAAPAQQSALVALTRRPVQCVVLNLSVAGSGGNLKVLDAIRTNPDDRVSNARVVLCSRGGTNRLFAWESGVDGFLAGPFHIDELLAQISEVVERPESERRSHRRKERDQAREAGRKDPTRAPGVVR
ncbi:MAG TPA: response regulator [Acidimicrobiales bacterium]|nr:response regulator [Acidimicrobiales bacterium]